MWSNKILGIKKQPRSGSAVQRGKFGISRSRLARLEVLERREMLSVTWSNVGPSAIYGGQVQNLQDNKVAGAVQAIAPQGTYAVKVSVTDVGGKSVSTSKTTFKVTMTQSANSATATAAGVRATGSPSRALAPAITDAALAALLGDTTFLPRSLSGKGSSDSDEYAMWDKVLRKNR